MNEMNTRNYNERDYDNRGYSNRYYDENIHGYRDSYRDNYRDDYREDYRYDNRDDYRDYRDDYRTREYDRRGGKINNRDYRNYRNYRDDYHEELEMVMEDMKHQTRKIEDISEMATNMQDKNMLMKIAQKEKENYNYIKQIVEK